MPGSIPPDRPEFVGYREQDNTPEGLQREVYFQSITSTEPCSQFSVEELRLHDYRQKPVSSLIQDRERGMHLAKASFNDASLCLLNTSGNLAPSMQASGFGSECQQRFLLHQSVAVQSSEFNRLALRKEWKDPKVRTILLPEDKPATFTLCQDWLYTAQMHSEGGPPDYRLLVEAYVFGEKMLDVSFKNAIAEEIIRVLYVPSYVDLNIMNLLYENTPIDSPLCRLVRDIYIWDGDESWFEADKLPEDINLDFIKDANREQMILRKNTPRSQILSFSNSLSGKAKYVQQEAT